MARSPGRPTCRRAGSNTDPDHTLAQCSRAARGGGATCANQTPIGTVASARKASCSGSTATSTSCSRSCASPRRACRSCSRSCSHWPSPSASVRSPASRVVCTTGPWWPPVSLHRLLFRRHQKGRVVIAANRLAVGGLVALWLALVGVLWFITDVLYGHVPGAAAAVVSALWFGALWFAMPLLWIGQRRPSRELPEEPEPADRRGRPGGMGD